MNTDLHSAVSQGHKEIVEQLIANGADVNSESKGFGNNFYGTPLHVATSKGNKEIAELLIAKGADVNAKNESGQTPLFFSDAFGLFDLDLDIPPQFFSSPEVLDIAELLIANGADVDA